MSIAEKPKSPSLNEYDVCIVGSGPAGMTLCNELGNELGKNSNLKICVLESGRLNKTSYSDSLRTVYSTGEIKIKENSRERVLGGTSSTWAGLSCPMDKIDLQTWPIKYEELEKYYEKISNYGFGRYEEFSISNKDRVKEKADFILKSEKLEEKKFIAKDPAWNFGKELRSLFDRPNIDLFIDSTVVEIKTKEKNGVDTSVDTLSVVKSNGEKYEIKAKIFILATGGIESVRLLLLSKDVCKAGLGNEHDQVGRYIMNHPKNNYGIIKLNKPVNNLDYLFGYLDSGFAKYSGFRFNDNIQKSLGLLNSYVRFEPIFPWTDSKGVSEFILLVKKAKLFLDWWKRRQKKLINLRDWSETGDDAKYEKKFNLLKSIVIILKDVRAVLSYGIHRLFQNKKLITRKIRLRNFMEMEALAENRIILGNSVDKNGQQIPEVKLNLSELDRKSLIELHKTLGEDIEKNGIGKLESNLQKELHWPILSEASHHLGGTIMGDDKTKSVVDKDLKVHSVNNLYICSGSVFPTSGCANPTYTICALAVRLAYRIKTIV